MRKIFLDNDELTMKLSLTRFVLNEVTILTRRWKCSNGFSRDVQFERISKEKSTGLNYEVKWVLNNIMYYLNRTLELNQTKFVLGIKRIFRKNFFFILWVLSFVQYQCDNCDKECFKRALCFSYIQNTFSIPRTKTKCHGMFKSLRQNDLFIYHSGLLLHYRAENCCERVIDTLLRWYFINCPRFNSK